MVAPSPVDAGGLLPPGVRPLRSGDPAEIAGYTLAGRLGSGGMGVVYLGHDPLGGLVAVKSAHGRLTDEELTHRLAAEAACLRRIPQGYTAGLISDGTRHRPPYIVTEYIEGRSLADVVDNGGPLPPEQVRAIATGVLRALAAVHRAGLVHRDLKPPNVVLAVAGLRLIDFGIAQEIGASGGPTEPGSVMGSPGWIAPERLVRKPAVPASDVFGWGCLVVYATTGCNPFGRGDSDMLARRVLEEPPDLDRVEEPLRALVAEALAKDPADRPTAEELLANLSGGEGVVARRTPAAVVAVPADGVPPKDAHVPPHAPVAHPRRRRALVGAAVTAAAVVLGVIVTTAADHDVPWTPPASGPSMSAPAGQATTRSGTHREPVTRPQTAGPRATTSTRPARTGTTPGGTSSQPPASVPTPVTPVTPVPSTPPGKGKGKGIGKGNGRGGGGGGPTHTTGGG